MPTDGDVRIVISDALGHRAVHTRLYLWRGKDWQICGGVLVSPEMWRRIAAMVPPEVEVIHEPLPAAKLATAAPQ